MNATGSTAAVTTIAEAGRYLSELTATVGFEEGVRRLRSKADSAVARELDALERYVSGREADKPAAALALYGDYLKPLSGRSGAATGAATINLALRDARALADGVRVGLPGDLWYAALLLIIAAMLSSIWLVYIAPVFAAMFATLGAQRLPAFSQLLFDAPWVVFSAIGVLAACLVLLVVGAWRLAAAIETLALPAQRWARLVAGDRVLWAQERWSVATLASAWASAGQEPLAALRDAIARAGTAPGELRELAERVALANDLGIARQELEHERERSLRDCRVALEVRRAIALRGMQIAVAALVGAITIAIYLPIFKMGAVI